MGPSPDTLPRRPGIDEARKWFAELPSPGIEGLVVKGADQHYEGGKRQWLKVKHRDTIHVICAAVTGPLDRPETLVLGLPLDGELRIVERSTPLNSSTAHKLSRASGRT